MTQIIAAALLLVLVSGGASAQSAATVQVRDGDVISAEVINALLAQLRAGQGSFDSERDLIGTWRCSTYDNNGHAMCPRAGFVLQGSIYIANQQVTFEQDGARVRYRPESAALGGCGHEALGLREGTIQLYAGSMARVSVTDSWQRVTKLSPTSLHWDSGLPYAFSRCEKITVPPAPVDELRGSVSGTVVSLTWNDKSNSEVGFRIERRSKTSTSWVPVLTLGADITSATDSPGPGEFVYRVFGFNSFGDSVTSSEVPVVVGS